MSSDSLKVELINIIQSYHKLATEQQALLQQLQMILETDRMDYLIKSFQTTSKQPEAMLSNLQNLETLNEQELFRKHKERLEAEKTKQLQKNELINQVDQGVKQQQRRNLWFDPYSGYKPRNPWEIH